MLTLYDYLPSQNAYKIRLLLQHLDQPYQVRTVSIFEGEGQRDHYLDINPTGAVPAIKLDNGHVLAESNAILIFLSEGSRYLPSNTFARAKIIQWLFFEADYIQSTVATLRHWILTKKDRSRSADLVNMKRQGSLKTLSTLDRELERNKFLGSDDYSIADMSVFAYVHRSDDADLPLPEYPNIVRWIDDIQVQPGFLSKIHLYDSDPYSTSELP